MTNEDNRARKAVMWLNRHTRRKSNHLRLIGFIFGVVVFLAALAIVAGSAYKEEIDAWSHDIWNQVLIVIGLALVCAGFGVWAIWFRKR